MFKRYLDRMPRQLYFTLKNFAEIVGIVIGGVIATVAIISAMEFSIKQFGNPLPVIGLIFVGFISWASYSKAKFDVDREKIEQERVEKSLKKDWE